MLHTKPELVQIALEVSEKHSLDPALVCSIVEYASHWNPALVTYQIAPMGMEYQPQFGMMQIESHTELTDPRENLEAGCLKLKGILESVNGDVERALKLWYPRNNNWAALVQGRIETYREFLKGQPA